jgi:hypothetical protein
MHTRSFTPGRSTGGGRSTSSTADRRWTTPTWSRASRGSSRRSATPTTLVAGSCGLYPLQLTWFDDGIYVLGAEPENRWAIGRRLDGIGTSSIDDAIAAMSPLVSRDNDAWLRAQLPSYLLDPVLLAGVDLARGDAATFRLRAKDGSIRELALRPRSNAVGVELPKPLPLHLQGPATLYWNGTSRWIAWCTSPTTRAPRIRTSGRSRRSPSRRSRSWTRTRWIAS